MAFWSVPGLFVTRGSFCNKIVSRMADTCQRLEQNRGAQGTDHERDSDRFDECFPSTIRTA
jgi:hypothetical protein